MDTLRGALAALVTGISAALVIVALAILPFLNPVWVSFAQERAQAEAWTGFTTEQLAAVTNPILMDLVLGPPDFDVTLDGAAVLNDNERGHMRDVRGVFFGFFAVAVVAAVVLVLMFLAARGPDARARFWRRLARTGYAIVAVTVVGGVAGLLFFDSAFILFHEIFFPGGELPVRPRHGTAGPALPPAVLGGQRDRRGRRRGRPRARHELDRTPARPDGRHAGRRGRATRACARGRAGRTRMSGGLPLARLFGIEVRISFAWAFVLAVVTFIGSQQAAATAPGLGAPLHWLIGVIVALGFLVTVVAHEISHALVGRRCGVPTTAITLGFIGGLAPLSIEAPRPRDEMAIAAAGPLCPSRSHSLRCRWRWSWGQSAAGAGGVAGGGCLWWAGSPCCIAAPEPAARDAPRWRSRWWRAVAWQAPAGRERAGSIAGPGRAAAWAGPRAGCRGVPLALADMITGGLLVLALGRRPSRGAEDAGTSAWAWRNGSVARRWADAGPGATSPASIRALTGGHIRRLATKVTTATRACRWWMGDTAGRRHRRAPAAASRKAKAFADHSRRRRDGFAPRPHRFLETRRGTSWAAVDDDGIARASTGLAVVIDGKASRGVVTSASRSVSLILRRTGGMETAASSDGQGEVACGERDGRHGARSAITPSRQRPRGLRRRPRGSEVQQEVPWNAATPRAPNAAVSGTSIAAAARAWWTSPTSRPPPAALSRRPRCVDSPETLTLVIDGGARRATC